MGALSEPRQLYHKWKFVIEIDGVVTGLFKSCSGVEWEAADVDLWEGGGVIPVKEPGRITVTDVTLERGVGIDKDLYDWAMETVDFVKNGGLVPQDLKRNVEIVQLARDGSELQRTTLFNAYVKKYSFGDWDNDADEARMEQVVLRYDFPKDTTDE